ncbi:MAG TPA: hypothetical protein VNL17_13250 [Verrucomicrobiae bacterium]|nr:hypothetical protein [Verrucomicrobiae bacterium]
MNINDLVSVASKPLFWIVSALFSILLSVVANLLTPRVSQVLLKRRGLWKQRLMKKQAVLLGKVIIVFEKENLILNSKLDSIHALLLACILLLFAFAFFFWKLVMAGHGPQWALDVVSIGMGGIGMILFLLGMLAANIGMNQMQIVRLAERRHTAGVEFLRDFDGEPAAKDLVTFFANWDKKEFGVTCNEALDVLSQKAIKSEAKT